MAARSWVLDDAEALHRAFPESFFIPPDDHRRNLGSGDVVKLLFNHRESSAGENGVERMWVEVREVVDPARYVGTLLNDPRDVPGLQAGDSIPFEARHVAAKDYGPEELGYDAGAPAAVSKRVRVSGEPPRRLIHDGGLWYVFVGDETQPEREDGNNFEWSSLGDLTDHFPNMTEPFKNANRGGYWDLAPDGTYSWFPF